ncbi:TPA: glycosyltransferase family 1 protein, partial [Streptococcus suis]|nr:glycosyltransferase family 1 protein [Streptococcus suis]
MEKKILLISTVPLASNGISTFVIESSKILSGFGNDVTILTINSVDEKRRKEIIDNNVNLLEGYNRQNILEYFFKVVQLIKKDKYDLVHVHGNSNTMSIELLAAKLAGCKVRIAHSHNTKTNHSKLHKILAPLFRSSITGRFACGMAAGRWLYQEQDFYVINNGVEFSKYGFNKSIRDSIREELNLKEVDILLGHIGGFNYQKNQEFLLDILPLLDERFKLIFLGDGEYFDTVQRKSHELGLSDRVFFKGSVNDVTSFLNALDIFVLPSRFEGLPFSLIEAKSAGLPCLISDRISKEANLAEGIYFLSIDDILLWKNSILKISSKPINRELASEIAIRELTEQG